MELGAAVSYGKEERDRMLTFVLGSCYRVSVLQAHCKNTAARWRPSSASKVVVSLGDNRGSRPSQGPRLRVFAEGWVLTACRALLSSRPLPALATILLKAIRRGMHQRLLYVIDDGDRSINQADFPTVEGE